MREVIGIQHVSTCPWVTSQEPDFKKRSFGNAAATAIAIAGGADLVRVHEAWLCYVLLKVMFIYFPRPMGRSTSGKYVFLS